MNKKHRLKRGTVLMIIGAMMILGALSLALYNHIKETAIGENSAAILDDLQNLIVKSETDVHESQAGDDDINQGLDKKDNNSTPDSTKPNKDKDKDKESKEAEETEEVQTTPHDPNNMEYSLLDGHYYIGILEMPTVGIKLPVQWGWSDQLMDTSPCRYNGNTEENNMILLAHNYTTHFGPLFNLNEGDPILFTDVSGHTITYHVYYKESFHRSELHRIYEGEWDMTMFTCVPNTYNRLAVRCVRVDG